MNATPWPDLMDLVDYWADHPPVHQLVAGFMGVKSRKKSKTSAVKATASDMQSLANLFNGS